MYCKEEKTPPPVTVFCRRGRFLPELFYRDAVYKGGMLMHWGLWGLSGVRYIRFGVKSPLTKALLRGPVWSSLHTHAFKHIIGLQGPFGLVTSQAGLLDTGVRNISIPACAVDKYVAGLERLKRLLQSAGIVAPPAPYRCQQPAPAPCQSQNRAVPR